MAIALTAVALALAAWTAWLVQRARLPRWWYAPTTIAALGVIAGTWLTPILLGRAFDATSAARASDRQAALSHGISDAMLPTAIAIGVVCAWLVVLAIASVRLRARLR